MNINYLFKDGNEIFIRDVYNNKYNITLPRYFMDKKLEIKKSLLDYADFKNPIANRIMYDIENNILNNNIGKIQIQGDERSLHDSICVNFIINNRYYGGIDCSMSIFYNYHNDNLVNVSIKFEFSKGTYGTNLGFNYFVFINDYKDYEEFIKPLLLKYRELDCEDDKGVKNFVEELSKNINI